MPCASQDSCTHSNLTVGSDAKHTAPGWPHLLFTWSVQTRWIQHVRRNGPTTTGSKQCYTFTSRHAILSCLHEDPQTPGCFSALSTARSCSCTENWQGWQQTEELSEGMTKALIAFFKPEGWLFSSNVGEQSLETRGGCPKSWVQPLIPKGLDPSPALSVSFPSPPGTVFSHQEQIYFHFTCPCPPPNSGFCTN